MFGYVKAYKPGLRMAEYETYKAVYCSLCRELGKSYGPFAKFILSYDFTFLAVLLLAQEETCSGFKKMRCAFNPLYKCNRVLEDKGILKFTAAAAMILFFYKLKDNLKDKGFKNKLVAVLLYPLFLLARNSAKKEYPQLEEAVATAMAEQAKLEAANCGSIDRASDPTATLLSKIFAMNATTEESSRILVRLGYCIGKWIYSIDALDDIDDDIKKGNYNPLIAAYNLECSKKEEIEAAKLVAVAIINTCTTEAAACFELLNVKRYDGILSNIIYLGMPDSLKNIKTKEQN